MGSIRRALALTLLLLVLLPGAAQAAARWTPYDRPATNGMVADKDVPITMSRRDRSCSANVYRPDKPGRYPVLITQTPYNKEGPLGRGQPVPRPARLRARRRRRPRHRRLAGHVGLLRAQRAARRPRGRRVGAQAAVERRQVGLHGAVVHGDHAADDRGAPPAGPEGDLPDRPHGGQLPRHHLLGRADQHLVHPAVARPGHRHEPRPAGLRARRQPAGPRPRAHDARPARDQRRQLPAQHRRQRDRGRRHRLRRQRTGRRARRSSCSTASTSRPSSPAACTTSSSAASRWSTSACATARHRTAAHGPVERT